MKRVFTWRIGSDGFAPSPVESKVGERDRQFADAALDLIHNSHSALQILVCNLHSLVVPWVSLDSPAFGILQSFRDPDMLLYIARRGKVLEY
jgi:hypothetical protein